MSKKSWPMIYSKLLYEMGQDFLYIKYYEYYNQPASYNNYNIFLSKVSLFPSILRFSPWTFA